MIDENKEIESEIYFNANNKNYILRNYQKNEKNKGSRKKFIIEKIGNTENIITDRNCETQILNDFLSLNKILKKGANSELMKTVEKLFKLENFKDKTFSEIKDTYKEIDDISNSKTIIENYYLYGKLDCLNKDNTIGEPLIFEQDFLVQLLSKVWKKVLDEKNNKTLLTRYDVLMGEIQRRFSSKKEIIEEIRKKIAKKTIEESRTYNFLRCSTQKLIAMSDCANSFGHHLLAGEAREEFCKEFLESVLPSDVEYFTGQLINVRGRESHQLDIILQSRSCPKMSITKESILGFYNMAMAVIEVKTTLREKDLEQFLNQCFLLKHFAKEEYSFLNIREIRKIETRGINFPILGIPHILVAYDSNLNEDTVKKIIHNYLATLPVEEKDKSMYLPEMIVNIKGKSIWKHQFYKNNIDTDNRIMLKRNTLERKDTDIALKELFTFLTDIFRASQDLKNNPINKYFGDENYL